MIIFLVLILLFIVIFISFGYLSTTEEFKRQVPFEDEDVANEWKREEAATEIQCFYRGMVVRTNFNKKQSNEKAAKRLENMYNKANDELAKALKAQ